MLWIERVHPDDRARVVSASDAADRDGTPFHEEYRAIARDGRIVWIRDESTVVARDGDGRPLRAHGVMFDITRQKEAEQRMSDAENRYRSLVEHLPVVTYVTATRPGEAGDDIRYVAPTVAQLSGYSVEDWLSIPDLWLTTIHPDDRATAREDSTRTDVTGAPFDVEYRMVRKDGAVIWIHDQAQVVERGDDEVVWQGVLQDVTARHDADERRREAELRFKILVEQLPAITYVEDPRSRRILYISPQIEAVYGYAPEEWIADPDIWRSRLHPEDRDRVVAADTNVVGDRWNLEYRSIARDGHVLWVRNEAVLLRDAHGDPLCWQGVIFDITEHKEAEERLREAEERYRTLVEQVPVVVYMDAVDEHRTALYISPQYERLTGYPASQRLSDPALWTNMLHPEDRERIIDESLRTNRTGEPFDVEYRIVRADGGVVWLHDHAVLTTGTDGVAAWQGVLTDITERRLAEEALGRRDDILEAAGYAAERFLQVGAWGECIDDVLERLGRAGGAGRAFLYRLESSGELGGVRSLAHEWCDAQAPARAGGTDDASAPSPLEVPVTVDGQPWGFMGFDDAGDARTWHTAEVDAVRVVANTLGAAIGRQRAAKRLSEAEARFRALVEQTPVITYLDECGAEGEEPWPTVYISPQVEQILGYTTDEWRAPGRVEASIHPSDLERFLAADRAHHVTGEPLDVEMRIFAKDGSLRWVRDQAVLLRDADERPRWSQGIVLDVTEQKLAEQQAARGRGALPAADRDDPGGDLHRHASTPSPRPST